MYLRWDSINLTDGVLRVRSNKQYGFKVKDSEQRDIPISAALLDKLRSFREKNPTRNLVTGTASDKPNQKLLRTLKRIIKNVGMNCGTCESCVARKECERWFLHKFRSTFVTTMLRSGLDLRSVMKLSGHADLASVERYLTPQGDDALMSHVSKVVWM